MAKRRELRAKYNKGFFDITVIFEGGDIKGLNKPEAHIVLLSSYQIGTFGRSPNREERGMRLKIFEYR